ncbi:MAG: adenylate/guanylate cyclase domain-containing protein [Dongiaceae bacterium]
MAEERAVRRLAAILAADVAGYTRLVGADEEGTLARVSTIRHEILDRRIGEHRGRIFNTMGDGFLVEFASVVDALRCAVAIQRDMGAHNAGLEPGRRMDFRIGINVGDVVVDGDDILGDHVIVASRLEGLAEPGGICVSARVQEDVRGRLDLAFEDLGERELKNVARPVRAYRARPGGGSMPVPAPGRAEQPSLAVLPFTNMSGDAEQAYFADGLAEDLITDLSKRPELLVIARHSSFAYKGRSVDIRSVARELGVRYVVEGSVRRASDRVRINAQLIDAASGNHLWAERYDRDLADIFAVQDEVVGEIVRALAGRFPATPASSRRRTTNLEAYELFVRGRLLAATTLAETQAARPLLRRAIELDPDFAEAHAYLAMSYWFGWTYCGESPDSRDLAREAACRAMALDPDNVDARMIIGYIRAYEGELAAGAAEIEAAIRINANHAESWCLLADLRVFEGRPLEAVQCAQAAIRLDPNPPGDYYWMLGWAHYAAAQYEQAVAALRHPRARGPGVRRILAAALARLGRMAEAQEAARSFLREFPQFSAQQWASTQPFRDDAGRQHFVAGYIEAGLPE